MVVLDCLPSFPYASDSMRSDSSYSKVDWWLSGTQEGKVAHTLQHSHLWETLADMFPVW